MKLLSQVRGGAEDLAVQVQPVPKRIHEFFERQCDSAPEAPALICGQEPLSYASLEERANRLAHCLAGRGVGPGDRVGLMLERSVHTYVAMLAILKSGAAFVPIDPSFPAERVAFIAEDAGLICLLNTSEFRAVTDGLGCVVLNLDVTDGRLEEFPATRLEVPRDGDTLCYVIYTSGSTGRPKGVAVNHSNVCHFLQACTPIYGVTAQDRVYQGMTLAFDFSIEEIWPTFIAGATLVAGPTDSRRFGSGLADFLTEHQITVMYCVPTLLATLDCDVPSLRTLVLGGEACPRDLVQRWSRTGRRILNTYGPTEATVTATCAELGADRPVTIGRPLPGYRVHLLDEQRRPVGPGEVGEICIGGVGVARGYLNCPELTAAKFIADPFTPGKTGARLYRTGDLGRLTPTAEIEYLGRIDNQVKIRGHRVELEEIEAVLLADTAVKNALVLTTEPANGTNGSSQDLVAYVTLRTPHESADILRLRFTEALRRQLPAYMVPAFIEIIAALPLLPSGKADRSRLPRPASPRLGVRSNRHTGPLTALERTLAAAWQSVLRQDHISVEADFFLDLGGHSLLAAQVISELRQDAHLRHLSIADLYSHPTVRALARHIQATSVTRDSKEHSPTARPDGRNHAQPQPPVRRYRNRRVLACGTAQFVLLYLVLGVLGAPAAWFYHNRSSFSGLFIWWTVLLLGLSVTTLVLPIAAKWLLIGRFRPGRYPLWGWYYCRFWLVRLILDVAPLEYFAGSPLMPLYARLLGARVGRGCHIGTALLHLPDLIEIGDGASIGYDVDLQTFVVEGGWLHLAPISIGVGAFVGTGSVIMPGGRLGRGARLTEQSLVTRDQTVPDGETWAGSPAQRCSREDSLLAAIEARPGAPSAWSPWLVAGFGVGLLWLEILSWLAAGPGLAVIAYAKDAGGPWWALAATPLAGLMFVVTMCALVAGGKRLVMPRVRPGTFPAFSTFGLRKWFTDKLMKTSLDATNTLYGTLYTLPWLRLVGARVGPRAEVSTVSHVDPDLLTLGPETFVADLASVGAATYHRGYVALGPTEAGTRSFIGNAAVVRSNTRLGENSLIGVQSVPPIGMPVRTGTSWLGSPPIFLPRRQMSEGFDETVTYRPRATLVTCRLAIEFWRVVLPPTLLYLLFLLVALTAEHVPARLLVLALPGIYLASALLVTLMVAGLKWLIVGRYRPRVEPAWSHFVWRTELITGLFESVVVPSLVEWLAGTPLMPPALRLFGARIGRRVYMESTYLTEFDLVDVKDDAVVSRAASLQTHLFEDRVMKMSRVTVGPGCAVGPRSVVLYDAGLATGATLDALSLVMKGETLPADTRWCGIPARPVDCATKEN